MPTIQDTIDSLRQVRDHDTANSVQAGRHIVDTVRAVGQGLPTVGRGVLRAGEAALAPFEAVGPSALNAAGRFGTWINSSVPLRKNLIGVVGLTPVIYGAMHDSFTNNEEQMLASSAPKTASLKEGNMSLKRHMIKTSVDGTSLGKAFGPDMVGELLKGLGGGAARGITDYGMSGLMALGRKAFDHSVSQPKREKVFYEAIRADSVLRDAVRSNDKILGQLKEAFATLTRFAPTMAEDINAVRSYLRESVLSGGGINYATIKQLAETEKLVQERFKNVRAK